MKNNFIKRTVTALFFTALLLSAVFIDGMLVLPVFSFFMLVSLYEFYQMNEKTGIRTQKIYGIIVGFMIFTGAFLNVLGILPKEMLIFFIIPILFIPIAELFLKRSNEMQGISATIFGLAYVIIPFVSLLYLSCNSYTNNTFNSLFLFPFFFAIWSNDTGAYISGILLGKHKLFERISPKKTWEGSVGGLVFALIAAYIISIFYKELSFFQWAGYALIIAVFGTLGDLIESMFKRRAGVKDSGTILPGHGGMLDRFDSALIAAPAAYIYIMFLEKFFV